MLDLSRIACLGDALRDAVVMHKSRVALLEIDRHREQAQLTYLQLWREAERIAGWLQAQGFSPGDRCALLMSNQSKWVVTSFAVAWCGGVLVPIDYKLTADEQRRLIAHAAPKVVVTEHVIARDLELAHGGSAPRVLVRLLVTEAPEGELRQGVERFEMAQSPSFTYRARTRDDVACIVYSSGTSGAPKGCMLTHDNYLEQAQALGRMFPMAVEDRYFSVLPTNHAIDFMCGTVIPFLFGAAVVHQRTLRAEFLAPTMQRYGVTHTALVPRILRTLRERIQEQLQERPEWQRRAIDGLAELNGLATMRAPKPLLSRALLAPIHARFGGKLRMIFAGGAFVERELADFFYRLGIPVAIGYGLTEAGTVITVNDLSPYRADSVGRPVPGVELRLRDMNDEGVGEVCVRARSVMRGYLDAPELTAEAISDGFLRTGDLGLIDASGHLKLVGRAKNMIVTTGGKNVYPEDVENAFAAVDCEELCVLAEHVLAGQPSSRQNKAAPRDESLVIVVRARKGQAWPPLLDALREANRSLADYKRVRSFVVLEREFPRTASLKIKREQLAALAREHGAAPQPLAAEQTGARA
jgi:long-chain acyl-CoA synthetase